MMNAITKTGTIMTCLVSLTACASMNLPIGDNFGAAVARNKQVHIVNKTPASSEQPEQSGARAAEAIARYKAGPQETGNTAETGSNQ